MAKKSKKQVKSQHKQKVAKKEKKQQPIRASEKKRIRREKKLVDQKENVVGNGAEQAMTPEEKAYMEDTRKPEPEPTPVFDPKKLVDEILKEYGV